MSLLLSPYPRGATPPGYTFVDEFESASSDNNYTITMQGSGGSHSTSGGIKRLVPALGGDGSVSLRRAGPITAVELRARLQPNANGESIRYLDLALGAGALTPGDGTDTGAWWHTTLATGYTLAINNPTDLNGAVIARRRGGGGWDILREVQAMDWTVWRTYGIRVGGGQVQFSIDGAVVYSAADATFTGGDVAVSQGHYSGGLGAVAELDRLSTS